MGVPILQQQKRFLLRFSLSPFVVTLHAALANRGDRGCSQQFRIVGRDKFIFSFLLSFSVKCQSFKLRYRTARQLKHLL
jgi:hypothetical protein